MEKKKEPSTGAVDSTKHHGGVGDSNKTTGNPRRTPKAAFQQRKSKARSSSLLHRLSAGTTPGQAREKKGREGEIGGFCRTKGTPAVTIAAQGQGATACGPPGGKHRPDMRSRTATVVPQRPKLVCGVHHPTSAARTSASGDKQPAHTQASETTTSCGILRCPCCRRGP